MITEPEISKLYPKLRAFAKSYSSWNKLGIMDYEDIVQKSLLEMIKYISKGDKIIENYEAFAVNSIKWAVKDAFKKKKDYKLEDLSSSSDTKEGEERSSDETDYDAEWQDRPQDGFEKTLRDQCLDELKDDQRIVLIMNSFVGFTTEKISSVLERPQNTVLTWLTKAKREFADCILGEK